MPEPSWPGMAQISLKVPGRSKVNDCDSVWQSRYYGFNVYSRSKIEEKLDYIHMNPVRAGLVKRAVDWTYSSARWYLERRPVGIPISWPPGFL